MKVILNLSLNNLNAVIHTYDMFIKITNAKSREAKVARSILDKTMIRFKKKQVSESYQPSLFAKKNKKFKVSLEIYEAHYLEQFALHAESIPSSEYDKNVLGFIKSNINQQLA